jgi:O-antigen/teichoic acid export membrane protein
VVSGSIRQRFVSGVAWSTLGSAASRGAVLLAMMPVARIIGREAYGQLGIIQNTVGMFAVFAGMASSLTATRYVAQLRHHDRERAGRIVSITTVASSAIALALAIAMAAMAPWLAQRWLAAPALGGVLAAASAMLVLGTFQGVQIGVLSGLERFSAIAWSQLLGSVVVMPLILVGAWWRGLFGTVAGLIAAQSLQCLINQVAVTRSTRQAGIRWFMSGWTREWSVLWKFSLPAMASGLLVGPVQWFASTLLVNRPDGYHAMAVYHAANQWFVALMFLPGILGRVYLPLASHRLATQPRTAARMVIKAVVLSAAVVAPLAIAASLASPFILNAYGADYASHWPTLVVVVSTAWLLAIQAPIGQTMNAFGRVWIGLAMNLGWAICYGLAAVWLVPSGAIGLALARLLAYLAHACWTFAFVYYLIRSGKDAVE